MDLIERYVKEVGRQLPRGQRADVEIELQSLLQDMVEDRAQTKVEKADEAIVIGVLTEMGPPQKVAASYQTKEQYLIGPKLFPIFKIVAVVVASVLGVIVLIGITLSVRSSESFFQDWLRLIITGIPDYLASVVRSLAIVVIIFAILERFLPEEVFTEEDEEDWNPRTLPAVNDRSRLNRSEPIMSIVFSLLFLILLNLFPQWAGFININDNVVTAVPLLSENFYANLLPWVNVSLLFSIVVNGYKLRAERRNRPVLVLELLEALLSAVVLYVLITNPPLFGVNAELLAIQGSGTETVIGGLTALTKLLNTLAGIGLPIIFLFEVFTAAKKVFELWRYAPENSAPPLVGKMS